MAERRRILKEWRPRLTVRARLTLTLATMLAAAGAIVIAGIYVWLRVGVSYALPAVAVPAMEGTPEPSAVAVRSEEGAVAVRVATQQDFYDTLVLTSVTALIVIIVLGAIVAWLVAGRMLKPLHVITDAARRAAEGTLDHRIGLQGPRDEFADLANTFDGMLDRLERAFHSHRRFAANASHELRTPLATSKAMLDMAAVDGVQDGPELVRRLRETNLRSIEIVEALLDLSDIDNVELRRQTFRLDEVVADVLTAAKGGIDERAVQVTATLPPTPANGDPVLIRRLVTNLVDNAVTHNLHGGSVTVTTAQDAEQTVFTVVNTVDGSVPLDADEMVEPFYRARGRATGPHAGHGLGLAIAQSIVAAHDGDLDLDSSEPGRMTVEVRLPRVDPG